MDCSRFKHPALWIVSNVSQGVKKGEKSQKRERKNELKIRNKLFKRNRDHVRHLRFVAIRRGCLFLSALENKETIGYGGNHG